MNALDLLRNDHQKLKDMFDTYLRTEGLEEKRHLFFHIRDGLEAHAHVEETLFYPSFNSFPEFKDLLFESVAEHQEMKEILAEINEVSEDEDEMDELVDELYDTVEHHFDQEEGEFFEEARKVMSEEQFNVLGQKMERALRDLTQAA